MKDNKHIQKFNEHQENLNISDVMYSELREKIRNIIASDWANHEDDYPYIEQTADECMETIKEFLNKLN
jgi:hypothetical protein